MRARDYKDPKLVKITPVEKSDTRVRVLHKNKTGNVKQGYSQTGSVFSAEDAIAPTLDVAAGRLFKVPKKETTK